MKTKTDNTEDAPRAGGGSRRRTAAVAAMVGVAGLVGGGVAAGAVSAASADVSSTASKVYPGASGGQRLDPTKSMRSDEKLLTGSTKTKVLAVVESEYPNATVQRVETDSDGVYEAHILDGGTPLTVQVGKDFTITGTQAGRPGGPGGDRHGPGDRNGDNDGDAPSA